MGAQFNSMVVMISQSGYLFQIEFVAEHPLTVLTHPRLSALPAGAQKSCHLVWRKYFRNIENIFSSTTWS